VWGSECVDPYFLDLGTRWWWVVSFTLLPLYSRGKSPPPPTPTGYEAGWAPEPVWMLWRRENSWPYRDSNSDPSAVQHRYPGSLEQAINASNSERSEIAVPLRQPLFDCLVELASQTSVYLHAVALFDTSWMELRFWMMMNREGCGRWLTWPISLATKTQCPRKRNRAAWRR
jgi:hypothetical protein